MDGWSGKWTTSFWTAPAQKPKLNMITTWKTWFILGRLLLLYARLDWFWTRLPGNLTQNYRVHKSVALLDRYSSFRFVSFLRVISTAVFWCCIQ
jgi:hypothetical protein